MAKVNYQSIPESALLAYEGALQPDERFIIPTIKVKTVILSRAKIKNITARSYLSTCSALWAGFTDQQKQDWKDVDQHSHPHGWRTFVADQSKRIKLGIPGVATPSVYHQDMVGKLYIENPAEELKISQPHPGTYYVSRKVTGTKSQYEPVPVTEQLILPLKLDISYKSDLVSTGAGSFAKFYADVRRLYQGNNISQLLEINIPLSHAWETLTETLSEVTGEAVSYNLYLHLYKVTGTLLIDNVKATHTGSNWVRDTYCKAIEQDFTRAFYQVPKNWAPITNPTGAQFLSVYPT